MTGDVLIASGVALAVLLYIGAKAVWLSGFMAGKDHEAVSWLRSIDEVFVPNWQSFPVRDESLTPEQLKFARTSFTRRRTGRR